MDENIAAWWSCRKENVKVLKLLFQRELVIDDDELAFLSHISTCYGYFDEVS
jgi:hypothetical protein